LHNEMFMIAGLQNSFLRSKSWWTNQCIF